MVLLDESRRLPAFSFATTDFAISNFHLSSRQKHSVIDWRGPCLHIRCGHVPAPFHFRGPIHASLDPFCRAGLRAGRNLDFIGIRRRSAGVFGTATGRQGNGSPRLRTHRPVPVQGDRPPGRLSFPGKLADVSGRDAQRKIRCRVRWSAVHFLAGQPSWSRTDRQDSGEVGLCGRRAAGQCPGSVAQAACRTAGLCARAAQPRDAELSGAIRQSFAPTVDRRSPEF